MLAVDEMLACARQIDAKPLRQGLQPGAFQAESLVHKAHVVCPSSNATRGNVAVRKAWEAAAEPAKIEEACRA